jgi:type IV secretion system protein VirD4
MNDNIRKYILPNIPYLFIFWACLKLGTAYRLAAGDNLAFKLIGISETIKIAFGDIAPGLNSSDWALGLIGAVLIRLVVWNKSKKAKNSERMWNMVRRDGELPPT